MKERTGAHVCAMQVNVKNHWYEVYWSGSGIVPFLDQARIYSRSQAQDICLRLVNQGKLFYAKEIM